MRRLSSITLLLAPLSLLPVCAAQPPRTPPGSFLGRRAATVNELVRQVSSDSAAKARYARHFRMSSNQVVDSLSRLKLVTLKRPVKTRSWYVGKNGSIQVKTKLLPRGTPVFATADGTPLLSWSCGNPLRAQLPKKPTRIVRSEKAGKGSAAVKAGPTQAEAPVETKVLAAEPETVGQPPTTAGPVVPVPEPVVAPPPAPLPLAQPVAPPAPVITAPPPVAPTTSPAGLGSAPAVAGLAGLFAGLAAVELDRSGKDRPIEPEPPPVPIPEPTGLAVVAVGIVAIRLRRCRRA